MSIVTQMTALELADLPAFDWFQSLRWRAALILEAGMEKEAKEQYSHARGVWREIGADEALLKPAERLRIETLKSIPYADYLRTQHWYFVRDVALVVAGEMCRLCSRSSRLQVHHRTYERRGEEWLQDVTVLCAGCHDLFHQNRTLAR